ncbi:Inner membrane protein YhaH [Ephemeroptericola cinctiostellae]|uniref:Inner membrane protein YhaH n=1 Tax=Ephemeroptericola cinctiostellae TaxID=2268024 RepID=A0A345DCN5_9BURK|nr:DUF805 domain-containing protein [Ephemeroptericola cinctiostellae]AXF86123.1 Inner membrane protein YhaH [Ephemeroptericola cinctiostellae]
MEAIKNLYLSVLKGKYAQFNGRASRTEYWTFTLVNAAISIVLILVERAFGGQGSGFLSSIFGLGVLIPGVAVLIRRLHDTDRSGWWALLAVLPLANLVLLAFMFFDGTQGANRFGENPKGNVI